MVEGCLHNFTAPCFSPLHRSSSRSSGTSPPPTHYCPTVTPLSPGNAGLRPHSSRGRGKPVTLLVQNNIQPGPKRFDVKAYTNSTVWEVRCAVAKHLKVAPERVRLHKGGEVRGDACEVCAWGFSLVGVGGCCCFTMHAGSPVCRPQCLLLL